MEAPDFELMSKPGYRLVDYQVVITPHEDLRNRILAVKKEISDKYNLQYFRSKPHITLVRFKVWEMMEEKIMNQLKVVAMGTPPFKMHLKDFGSFPTHTIFIKAESQVPIQQMQMALRCIKKLARTQDHEPHFLNEPFISIAQKIPSEVFDKAWPEYSHRHFTAHFIADHMTVLKRKEGDMGFRIVDNLQFENLPVYVKQGDLF